jgi:hypothetical protein
MRKNYMVLFLVLPFFLFSCVSSKNSNKKKGEIVDFHINEKNAHLITAKDLEGSRGPMAVTMLEYASKGVQKLIEMNKKSLTASYSAGLSNIFFYENISVSSPFDPSGIKRNEYALARTISNGIKPIDTALYMAFSIDNENIDDIINNSMFRLKLDSFALKYAKARVPVSKWYIPWTWFGQNSSSLNLDIEIIITSSWVNENAQIYKNVEIGRFMMRLRDVPMDQKEPGYDTYFESLKGKKFEGFSYLIPRSYGAYYSAKDGKLKECYGRGEFSMTIKIKEAGKDFFISTLISDSSPMILDQVTKSMKKQLK